MNELTRIPDNETLPQQYKHRPDWDGLTQQISNVDGKALAREHLLYRGLDDEEADNVALQASHVIQSWVDIDTDCKKFAKEFPEWFKNDCTARVTVGGVTVIAPVQLIIDLGKRFDAVRLAETKACESLRKLIAERIGPYNAELDRQTEEARLQAEAEETKRLLEEKFGQVRQLNEIGTPEAQAEAEALAAEPVLTPAVSNAQASAIAGTAAMRPNSSKSRATYKYTITDYAKFFAAQAANPARFADLYTYQSDKSYRVSFASWKNKQYTDIPGLKCEFDKYETMNRGK